MGEVKSEKHKDWIWWKHGVIYHIYTRSFNDSNGDGIGDIQGIIRKLDYLKELGIDAIWLSPIYESPNVDFGYDVSNYREINPEYGTLNDLKHLLDEAHKRGIRLIMDMILNHTSVDHHWFKESSSSQINPKRDWYIWHDAKKGKVPNNWKSAFGRSGWEWHKKTDQYYFHSFLKEQADLNWRNPEVQEVFFEEIRFWLDFGIDGFRLDVINFIAKDKKFRNNPSLLGLFSGFFSRFTHNRPASYKIVKKLRKLIDSYPNKMTIGEIYTTPPGNPKLAASYLGNGNDSLHLTFNFALFFKPWNAKTYYRAIEKWMDAVPKKGWPCFVFSNHDLNRSINRIGIGPNKTEKAKVLAALLLTLKGTPFIYYGEEIGLPNISIPRKDIKDPVGKRFWPLYQGRDCSRTPMRWNNYIHAGFSESEPWLPIGPDIEGINVRSQKNESNSIFSVYERLIKVRNSHIALQMGNWIPLINGKKGTIAYYRQYQYQKILVILNFMNKTKYFNLPGNYNWKIIFSLHLKEITSSRIINLYPFEVLIIENL